MANHFCEDCIFCGVPIRMVQSWNGKWQAYERGYNQGRHFCRSGYAAKSTQASAAVKVLGSTFAKVPDESGCNVVEHTVSGYSPVSIFMLLISVVAVLIAAGLCVIFLSIVLPLFDWLAA